MSVSGGKSSLGPTYRRVLIDAVNDDATEVKVVDGSGWTGTLNGTIRPKAMGLPAEGEVWLIERLDATTWMLRAQIAASTEDLGPEVNAIIAQQVAEAMAARAAEEAERMAREAALAAGIVSGDAVVLIQDTIPGPEHQNDSTLWIDTRNGMTRPMRWDGEQWIVVVDQGAVAAARAAVNARSAADAALLVAQQAKDTADAARDTADAALEAAEDALLAAAGKGRVIYGDPATTPGEANSLLIGPGNVLYYWDGSAWAEATPDMLADIRDELDDLIAQVNENISDLSTLQSELVGVQGLVDGKSTIYPVGSSPVLGPEDAGDLRLLVDGGVEFWDGTQWLPADPRVAAAVNDAAEALGLVHTKSTTYYKATKPTPADIEPPETAFSTNDLWIRTGDNRLHRWDGLDWAEVKDAAITQVEGAIVDLQDDLVGVEGRLDGKSTVYVQETAPTDVGGMEDKGDIWIDTSNSGRVYKVWDGTQWLLADDPRVAQVLADVSRKVTTYYGATAPTGTIAEPLVRGDLWVRAADNRLHRYDGSEWVEIADQRIHLAEEAIADLQDDLIDLDGKVDSKAVVWYQAADPSSGASPAWDITQKGDIWIDISTPAAPLYKVWTGNAWETITDPAALEALAGLDRKITTYFAGGTTAPSGAGFPPPEGYSTGDLWMRSSDKRMFRYDGVAWVDTTFIDSRVGEQAAAITGIQDTLSSISGTVDGKAVVYVQNTDPRGGATWGNDQRGDIWIDTSGSATVYKVWDGAAWKTITDPVATAALEGLDSKVTTYYAGGTTAPSGQSGPFVVGDLWVHTTTKEMRRYDGSNWVDITYTDPRLADTITDYVVEYAVNSSETVAPTSGWSTSTPTRTPGTFIWFRTLITYADGDTTTSSAALLTGNAGAPGAPAPVVSLTASANVLTQPAAGGATSPATATVTGTATNTTITAWDYSTDGGVNFVSSVTGVSRSGNVVTITGASLPSPAVTVRARDAAGNEDRLTVARVNHGAAGGSGADAYTVLLSNEAHAFAGSATAALASSTTSTVTVLKGATAQTAQVGAFTSGPTSGALPTGLSATVASNNTTAPVITLAATTALTATSGTVYFPVTADGKTFTKSISWSVSRTGATGVSVSSVTPYFLQQAAADAPPAAPTGTGLPPSPWSTTEPAYAPGTALYRVERIVYSSGSVAYTAVTRVSTYAGLIDLQNQYANLDGRLDGKATIYYQPSAPTGLGLDDAGDIWIDSDATPKKFQSWSGTGWVDITDQGAIDALDKIKQKSTTYYAAGTTAPTGVTPVDGAFVVGDLWLRTSDQRIFRYDGTSWVDVTFVDSRVAQQAGAISDLQTNLGSLEGRVDGKAVIHYQNSAPTGLTSADAGDIWIDADANPKVYKVWSGSAWQDVTDEFSKDVLSRVNTKVTTYYKATQPTAGDITAPETTFRTGDLWVRTSDNRLHRYDGTTWVDLKDSAIDAIGAAMLQAENAIPNASFEYGLAEWGTEGGGPAVERRPAATIIRTGDARLNFGTGARAALSKPVSVTPGETWRVGFFYMAVGALAGSGGVRLHTSVDGVTWTSATAAGGTGWSDKNVATSTSGWTEISVDYTVPSGVRYIRLRIATSFTSGSIYVDDAFVKNFTEVKRLEAATSGVYEWAKSRGTDLVTNGTGYLGNNTNFSSFVANPDAPEGASLSFDHVGGAGGKTIDEIIPVDVNKAFQFSYKIRQRNPNLPGTRHYGMVAPVDASGSAINPTHYMYRPGTTTTLAQELKPGDTVVHLTSAANWQNNAGSSTHWRRFIFWNYTDPKGKTWPVETYSRDVSAGDIYADGAIDFVNNTITLKAPWTGKTYPAGHPVSNGGAGGNYMYVVSNKIVPTDRWDVISGVYGPGVHAQPTTPGADPTSATRLLPPGTAAVRLGWLLVYNGTGLVAGEESIQSIAAVSLSDAAAAAAIADGKATIWYQNTAPPLTAGDVGDIWVKANASPPVYQMWSGTAWVDVTDPATIGVLGKIDKKTTTYYAAGTTAPTGVTPLPGGYVVGDLWVHTTTKALKRYDGANWVDITDARLTNAASVIGNFQGTLADLDGKIDDKAVVYYQATDPSAGASPAWGAAQVGDIWIDSTNPSAPLYKVWTGSQPWKTITDPVATQALSTVRTKITTYYKATKPVVGDITAPETQFRTGDLWVRTTDNRLHRYDGSDFVEISDARIGDLVSGLADTQNRLTGVEGQVDGKANVYYGGAKPTLDADGNPLGADDKGDIWIDTSGGQTKYYVWPGSGDWVLITDPTAQAALAGLSGKVTTYYASGLTGPVRPNVTAPTGGFTTGDLWIRTTDKRLFRFDGTSWVEIKDAAITDLEGRVDAHVKTFVVEYAVGASETVAPTTGWSTAQPTRTPGTWIWYRTRITYGNNTEVTSSPALLTGPAGAPGANAPIMSVAASTWVLAQASTGTGATTPATSTVTATPTGTTLANWTFAVDGSSTYSSTVPAGVSVSGSTVTITGGSMTARTVSCRANAAASGVFDTATVARVLQGAPGGAGANATTILLTNESHVFPGSNTAALAGTAEIGILAFNGATQVAATIGTVTGQTAGQITAAVTGSGTTSAKVTVTVTTALTATSGTMTIPVTANGVTVNKTFSWSVSRMGSVGVGVLSITPYFLRQASNLAAPAKPTTLTPPAGWVTTEPDYLVGNSLYRTDRVRYDDGTSFAYTDVTKVSSWEIAATALTSANGRNSRITSTAPASGSVNPQTGLALVEGDTWWQWKSEADRTVIGQWTWKSVSGTLQWVKEAIGSETIANLDVAKLVVADEARIPKAVVGKIIGDAGHFGELTIAPGNLFPDPEFRSDRWTGSAVVVEDTALPNGRALRFVTALTGQVTYGPWETPTISVIPGETYRVRATVKKTGSVGSRALRFYAGGPYVTSGLETFSQPILVPETQPVDTTQVYEADFVMPNTVGGKVTFGFRTEGGAAGATFDIAGVEVIRKVKGTMIDPESVASTIGDFVYVTADHILGGEIEAAISIGTDGFIRVGPETGPHVYIGNGMVESRIPGQAGPIPQVTMGGSDTAFRVLDINGAHIGGIEPDGRVVAPEADIGVLRLAGDDLIDILTPLSGGVKVWLPRQTQTFGPYSSMTGLWDFDFEGIGGRRYRIDISGRIVASGSRRDGIIGLKKTQSAIGTPPPAPTISSSEFGHQRTIPTPNGTVAFTQSFWYMPNAAGGTEHARFLAYVTCFSGNTVEVSHLEIIVTDLGLNPDNQGRASLGGASGQPAPIETPPAKDYVKTFDLTPHQVWTQFGSGDTYAPSWVRSGNHSSFSSIYRTFLMLPSAALSALDSASSVTKVEVRLAQNSGWPGQPWFGTHTATNITSSHPSILDAFQSSVSQQTGQTKWHTLSTAARNRLATGGGKGIVVGRTTAVTNQDFYGPSASSSVRPQIRISYKA